MPQSEGRPRRLRTTRTVPKGVTERYYIEREREKIIEYIHSDSEFKEVRSEYAEGRGQHRGPREIQELELQNKTSDRAVVRVTYDHAGPCEEKRWDACTTSTFRATLRTNETGAWKIWSENSLG